MRLVQLPHRASNPETVILGLILIETGILAAFGAGLIGPMTMFFAHLAALAAFAFGARCSFEADATLYVLAIVACASAGPFGAAAILVLVRLSKLILIPAADLQLWHDRLSGVTQGNPAVELAEKLKAGRLLREHQRTVTNFHDALRGPLATQQRVLGTVGLSYHPAYRSVLDAALASTEPSIRVHAAAVSVKIRNKNKSDVRSAMQTASDPADADAVFGSADTLARAARSGFLDTGERIAEARIEALRRCGIALLAQPASRKGVILKCELLLETGADAEALALADAYQLRRHSHLRAPIAEALIRLRRASELRDLLTRPANHLSHP